MSAAFSPQVVILVLNLLALAGSAALFFLGAPYSLRRRCQLAEDRVDGAVANVESVAAKWSSRAAEMTTFVEEVENALAAMQRTRRRVVAAEAKEESRERAQDPAADDGGDLLALKRRARQQGYPV